MGEARNHLKAATLLKHDKLDHELSALRLGERDHYLRFLWVNAPVIGLERALEAAGVGLELPDWPLRTRADALLGDLSALGAATDIEETVDLDLSEPATRLGLAYVLEGSRLGAAVLRRAVHASGDERVRTATRFLDHGSGQDLWRIFLARLEAALDDEGQRALAARAANWGFDLFLSRAEILRRAPERVL
jgi:heme oxygenase